MSLGRYIRTIITITMLLTYGAGEVWAQVAADDIIIKVMPSGKEGKGSVTDATYGSVSANVGDLAGSGDNQYYPVTLTVTPINGYRTKAALIVAEKMVDPGVISARRRTPGIGTFEVTGSDNTYIFNIDKKYHGAYVTVSFEKIPESGDPTPISTLSEINDLAGNYILVRDIDASGLSESLGEFTGTLDGNYHKIFNLGVPLFSSVNGGTVKNVTFEDVNINVASGDAGTVTALATGSARIYNCGILPSYTDYDNEGNIIGFSGSSVSGSGNVGGLVGKLEGTARVINCYSYANITGGTTVGGIVGNNTETTTSASLNTMVMNCMFYGNITSGNKAPIYNGTIITNDGDASGVNNFNYFWAGASYVKNKNIDNYYCALSAETRFLQRFEFFRNLLNSNRELAAWWVKGSDGQKSDMAKWVLEPSQIGSNVPFPILKTPSKYASVVNYTPNEIAYDENHRNEGRKLTSMGTSGKLSVTIRLNSNTGDTPYSQPTSGVSFKSGENGVFDLTITDKDTLHYNFNYGKVQLPYYNDYCVGNYTGYRVVTGWKIVSITGGTAGSYYTGENVTYTDDGELDKTPYNFADRKCTDKDLYDGTGEGKAGSDRVFNQGAYWDVPEGVTAITIEPYWGKAVYLSDAYWDVTYKNGTRNDKPNEAGYKEDAMTTSANVPNVGGGQRYNNGESKFNDQLVYTSMSNAIASSGSGSALFQGVNTTNHTVYDYAVVLVGNYHHTDAIEADEAKPYTVTSVDLDGDNEPDYSLMLRFNGRTVFHPVRYDFLNLIGLGMAQKSFGGKGSYNLGIMQPKYWFEVTNTALLRVTQFEYDRTDRLAAPYILQGGVFEQWVSGQNNGVSNNTIYFHVGGNVWFKEFQLGTHIDQKHSSNHPPISVTGGDFKEFYLTGLYRGDVTSFNDNAECYINGGRFGVLAGAGQEGLGNATNHTNGNITWQIDNADITEFYGGGFNQPIQGNIITFISNSYVDQFCGGPKFGDMYTGKTVKTIAENCTFGTYFGAGFGGNAYSREAPTNVNFINGDYTGWNTWVNDKYTQAYSKTYNNGVSTKYDYQYLPMSNNTQNVARIFIDYVRFSLATTHEVTSLLTDCHITGNFYGGGSLGKVAGNVNSTLTNCLVDGSVFGAGYSASTPTVDVMNTGGFTTAPFYDENLGAYFEPEFPSTVSYTWQHKDGVNSTAKAIDKTNHILYTSEDLTALGTVTGNVILTIDGNTTLTDGKVMSVAKSVYGGGEESNVAGNTQVNITGGTITQNVFGGGKGVADNFTCDKAMVGNNGEGAGADLTTEENKIKGTKVTISNGTVNGNVYGGGEVGRVEWNTQVKIGVGTGDGPFSPIINGSVFGAGKGEKTHGYAALVRGNSTVTVQGNAKVLQNVYGGGEQATVGRYWVKGVNDNVTGAPTAPTDTPDEMPYQTMSGGKCTVVVQGSAQVGPDGDAPATATAGHVFGAGKGVTPDYNYNSEEAGDANKRALWSKRMVDYNSTKHTSEGIGTAWDYFEAYTGDQIADNTFKKYVWEYFVDDADPTAANYKSGKDKYFEFLQTLALVTGADVTIDGGGTVKGNVYGGSESGFVQDDTRVTIEGENCTIGTETYGNVFGGGKGLPTFAEAGKVKGTTTVAVSAGDVYGNVYGGGELGDVGIIDKTEKDDKGKLTYNYHWKQSDGNTANVTENNKITGTNNNTGICKVAVSGGTIGTSGTASAEHGNVYGAGKGTGITWWCEKAISYATSVTITAGTVNGNVYGGGQVGRVEDDAKVLIGTAGATGDSKPTITGSVFGAGAGLETHGYSALVRGNAEVTVQGTAQIGGSVYGGGETASVGKFEVVGGLPTKPKTGGTCIVNIKDNAKIGESGTGHNVYGACKGVEPTYVASGENRSKSMQLLTNAPSDNNLWSYYEGDETSPFIWRYYATKQDYLDFLKTLALTSHPHVTIGGTWTPNETTGTITASGSPTVYGSVYGGGQRGVTLGHVDVNMVGGTVEQDVYGGGALADTNLGNWDVNGYVVAAALNEGESITDLYARTGAGTTEDPYKYTKITDNGTTFSSGTYYRQEATWAHTEGSAYYTTTVDLTGGTIKGDAYGGGLGQRAREAAEGVTALDDVPAYVFGDVTVKLNEGVATDAKGAIVNRVFAANNLNGSPQGNTSVYVYATQSADAGHTTIGSKFDKHTGLEAEGAASTYDVQAVYGGGNEASYLPKSPYTAENTTGAKSQVIIEGCDLTSIKTVYGGGNAASVPETNVTVKSVYEIEDLFGGGNGKDDTSYGKNPGADIGVYKNASNSDVLYGTGNVNVTTQGGYIHELFGASNQKGSIKGDVALNMTQVGTCTLQIDKVYNAGRNADIEGNLISVLSCQPATKILEYYGGAENANVKGNVELTITNGWFEKVFAGNNQSGSIFGHIKLNVEETGCSPIRIDELYGCGNDAAYSVYGYYVQTEETENGTGFGNVGENPLLNNEKLVLLPRTSADDPHKPVKNFNHETQEWTVYAGDNSDPYPRYDDPEVNIVSATYIGKVFGGGYGANGTVYGNPQVFINMIPGEYAAQIDRDGTEGADNDRDALGEIGIVYGGGNEADVVGNTFVNIGTKDKVKLHLRYDKTISEYEMSDEKTVEGAYITGNVYGGGKGEAKMEAGTAGEAFLCAKAMVKGDDGTHVNIGNGLVTGSVYGGGEKGRVEHNTEVKIGLDEADVPTGKTSAPIINGNVFGAGKGVNTHGYSALVRGTSTVTVQADAKVRGNVYGGGEIASVGKYKVENGLPVAFAPDNIHPNSGYCYVNIRGNAEIGPDDMEMTKEGGPSDAGHVFGAGKGVLPYENADEEPFHMNGTQVLDENNEWDGKSWEDHPTTYPAYNSNAELDDDYVKFIKSLALATQTVVAIEGNPFIKGSVYGGSENGFVQQDTHVTISGGQIGNGYVQMDDNGNYLPDPLSVNRRYTTDEWSQGKLIMGSNDRQALKDLVSTTNYTSSLPECASWRYGAPYAPYDVFAEESGNYPSGSAFATSEGGRPTGSDGHTFFGNVFGGGSGYYPYKAGRWFKDAGAVYGDTYVTIKGGHILTSVYGGNEMTDVGKYDDSDRLKLLSGGNCYVTMIGGTLGVPRTLGQIDKHPVTCYLFGAGKGDQRVFFNKSTNVGNVFVHISDDARIYGSIFGGGEDGHVMKNVTMNIGGSTLPTAVSGNSVLSSVFTGVTLSGSKTVSEVDYPYIGTWGTSYVDGNVFGAGRGFGGDAYTAGNVAGTVTMNIYGGTMLGSVYGGGRLGSVGYGLFDAKTSTGGDMPGYGEMRPDNTTESQTGVSSSTSNFPRGYVYMTIGKDDGTGPIIGNTLEYIVPSASSGPMSTGDNPAPTLPADIKDWLDEDWTAWKKHNNIPKTEFDTTTGHLTHTKGGNVFAGGMGRLHQLDGTSYISAVDWWKLGCVKSTTLTIKGGTIRSNVYGGGELGQVVEHHTTKNAANEDVPVSTEISISGSKTQIGTEVKNGGTTEYTFGSVFGGGYGSLLDDLTVNGVTSYPKFDAGLVKEDTKIDMQGGVVKASIYGGGEMASVGKIANSTAVGSTYVTVSGGTVGIEPITLSDNSKRYFGGAKMGNVYGGGSGHGNTVRSGKIFNSTNVTISDGIIYHNVYGGGAYGTVGDFAYSEQNETVTENGEQITVNKVSGISGHTEGTGVATVTITGGTIGYDGNENGMVFGSSRGDINQPGARDDYTAWVYDTHVTIGTKGSETGPQINGTVYGSGENGHTYNNTVVTVNSGTIGIAEGSPIGTYTEGGATYPYRGNVYGGGCGTDKYYHDAIPAGHTYNDGEGDYYNALAGIVYGTTRVDINGGTVVRNVYGAGAMGSVGKTTWTTTTTGEGEEATTTTTATTDGGSTTVNINGGIIGISGTVGDGNVFGAARGAKDIIQTDYINDLSRVSVTNVNVSGGLVKGNVYGGGELGDVGTIIKNTTDYNYTWQKTGGGANTPLNNGITENNTNTGICNVTITGGTIGSTTEGTGNVFGGGKGDANTWWCEKAMAFATNVNVREASGSTTKVYGTVYGGGEIGRVEDDSKVIIGTENGEDTPEIVGSVFGAGKGLATRGYSALVRGNSVVTVQGSAQVGGNVFGGGEEASLGRFNLVGGLPKSPLSGGSATVTIQDNANIGLNGTSRHVYGAGQGVAPNFDADNYKNFKSMQLYDNRPKDDKDVKGTYWDYYVDDDGNEDRRFVWVYYKTEPEYQAFLNTLAIASHPTVTIAENATVYGDVYGGGQRGITLGDVSVNITGGTVMQDVYGGGSLADTNKGNWDNGGWATGKYDSNNHATTYKTNVALTGGTINRNVYGGGLGQLAKAAVAAQPAQGTEGEEGYVPAVAAQPAVSAVEAKVYGDVLVELNKPTSTTTGEGESATTTTTYGDCEVKGTIFGCNNLNGSPQSGVTVHVYKTVTKSKGVEQAKPTKNTDIYEVTAVYGGGNLASYYPDDVTTRATAKTNVIIDGCDLTSIRSVYGGGNAASVPETEVVVNGTWEIGEVFAGGNGNTDVSYDGGETYKTNPGANVGYRNYSGWDEDGNIVNASDADTKEHREANYAYGQGKAHVTIYGGTVHKVFGGSNKRGNVRVEARTTLIEGEECEFNVGEAYGGGNDAPMDGDAILEAGCIPGLDIAYGGAANADVNGDVVLNITNGTYGRVFGGNDQGGVIRGTITVNIEETGCRPIVIGQLYGGGNLAAYSVDNIIRTREDINFDDPTADNYYKNYPKVNVKSFTSIGTIFGGGYGSPATLVGNPQVNVNVYQGKYCNTFKNKDNVIDDNAKIVGVHVKYPSDNDPQYETGYPVPKHVKGAIGAINDVFGGGNEAKVIGTPTVNIGTEAGEEVYAEVYVKTGESVEGYYTSSINAETGAVEYTATAATDVAVAGTTYYMKTVKAVDIRGNVYGGGNNADVQGDTNVVIGKKAE